MYIPNLFDGMKVPNKTINLRNVIDTQYQQTQKSQDF